MSETRLYDGYAVAPLTPDRWDDFQTVLGRGGIGGCWCTYWLHDRSEAFIQGTIGGARAPNKALFQTVVAEAPPGLLAYADDAPVAWLRVMDRARYPGLARSRHFKTDLDTAGVWSLTCFVVRRAWRGRGLSEVLIRAAIDHARAAGARILEAYPIEADEPRAPATIYTGVASTFRRLGFEEVQRRAPHRPMLRRAL